MSTAAPVSTGIVLWAGIDVAAATMEVALDMPLTPWGPPADHQQLPTRSFPRSPEGVSEMASWLEERAAIHGVEFDRIRVVMESTGAYSHELAYWIVDQCPSLMPAIINARRMALFAASLSPRHKTDRSDARIIARFGTNHRPSPFDLPDESRQRLISLVRHRENLIVERTSAKNRLKAPLVDPDVRASLERLIKFLNTEIERAGKKITRHYKEDAALSRDIALIKTIDGVGEVTAVTIVAELGDLRRFEKARQLSAFAGLAPRHTESGTSIKRGGRIVKMGSPRVRRVLLMAAWAAIRKEGGLQDYFNQLVAHGKGKLQAGVALMRKILVLMRAILISGQPYDPYRLRNT